MISLQDNAGYGLGHKTCACYPHRARIPSLLVIVITLCSSGAVSAGEKRECTPTRDPEILKRRQEALRTTANRLLEVLRMGDTEGFFKLVHEKYFGVGEGADYTVAELREMFRKKDELYCRMFDSKCIKDQSPNVADGFLSFSELAQRSDTRVGAVEVWATEGLTRPGCSGHANIVWAAEAGVEMPRNVTRFTFMYAHKQWKTVGFHDFVYIRRHINPSTERK